MNHAGFSEQYTPPSKLKAFIKQVQDAFGSDVSVTSVPSTQKSVLYIAEMHFADEPKVARLFCSKNRLYWAIVEGDNLELATEFFESIQITK